MSDIKTERGFKFGLMIDDCMYAVEKESCNNDVTIYRDNLNIAVFEGNDDFSEFLNLLCIAKNELEKQNV